MIHSLDIINIKQCDHEQIRSTKNIEEREAFLGICSRIYMYLSEDENHTIVPINIKNQNRNMLRHKKDNKKINL